MTEGGELDGASNPWASDPAQPHFPATGTHWLPAMLDADSVERVEYITRVCVQAALGREVHVDMAPQLVHPVAAMEIGVTLIALAEHHPEVRLSSVRFLDLGKDWKDTEAYSPRGPHGTHVIFNLPYFGRAGRVRSLKSAMNAARTSYLAGQASLGAAVTTAHEMGHALSDTASYLVPPQPVLRRVAHPEPWTWPDAISGAPSLWTELDRRSGRTQLDAEAAKAKDYRNPVHDLARGKAPHPGRTRDFAEMNQSWGLLVWKIKDHISGYAAKDRTEFTAEAFTHMTAGVGTSPIYQASHERMMTILGHPPDHRLTSLPELIARVHARFSEDMVNGLAHDTTLNPQQRAEHRDAWRATVTADRRARRAHAAQTAAGAPTAPQPDRGRSSGPDTWNGPGTVPSRRPHLKPPPRPGRKSGLDRGLDR